MALRMNLRGWSLDTFLQTLGSGNAAVLNDASSKIAEAYPDNEALRSKAQTWLRTLVEQGFPLRKDRSPPSEPDDGGLLTWHMETEMHAVVVLCLAQSIALSEHLDLSNESDTWWHSSVGALYNDMVSCRFTRSKECSAEFLMLFEVLLSGSPLFGDDFRSEWAFYSIVKHGEIGHFVDILRAAVGYQRQLPEGTSKELAQSMRTELSDPAKEFAGNLIDWFGRIHDLGQDAFTFWC